MAITPIRQQANQQSHDRISHMIMIQLTISITHSHVRSVRLMRVVSRSSFERILYARSLIIALLFTGLVTTCAAQDRVYDYARPGYPTKTIYVWGAVSSAGIWRVESDTDLIEFLSAVRLPGFGSDQRGRSGELILRMYRNGPNGREEIYVDRVKNLLVGTPDYPALQDMDIVTIEVRPRIGWQSVASVLGALSSFTLLVIRLTSLV